LPSGKRLDLIAATAHDRHVAADYARLRAHGIITVREGLRWHLIERTPYVHDFQSVVPLVRAARDAGMQVIWDLCHFGWPADLDIFQPAFVRRFARLARAFAVLLAGETNTVPFITPINEISFLSWAAGEVGCLYPFAREQGLKLKAQLVRAAIAGSEAVRDITPGARLCQIDPVFHVVADPAKPHERDAAEAQRRGQFQTWDMLAGCQYPQLGGHPKYLDLIGVNYYPWNQWRYVGPQDGGPRIYASDPAYRPFREILHEVYERYRRPLFLGETGTEGEARPGWLRYVGAEVRAARAAGVSVEGICLYPIVNFPGWDDERHCHNGLWDYADEAGDRAVYEPLAHELRRQQRLFLQT
jgi:beta-glucosidase/6-phospho-beta-glucosidase/beta-galactosidase